jgi:hypothetical protein
MAGRGFVGQDAGKLANAIRSNQKAYKVFVDTYVQDDPSRKAGIYAGMILERLEHLAWNAHVVGSDGFSESERANSRTKIGELISALQSITGEYGSQ